MFNRDSTNTTSMKTLDLIAFLTLPFMGWNQKKFTAKNFNNGLEIRSLKSDCEKTPVRMKWTELSLCLKYSFI